jgi:hypothetical protein
MGIIPKRQDMVFFKYNDFVPFSFLKFSCVTYRPLSGNINLGEFIFILFLNEWVLRRLISFTSFSLCHDTGNNYSSNLKYNIMGLYLITNFYEKFLLIGTTSPTLESQMN